MELGMLATATLSIFALFVGKLVKSKVKFFQKYYIPSPVIGGLLFAIVILVLNITGLITFEFDTTIQTLAMTLFFTSVGYMANLNDIKKGGIGVLIFLIIATLLIVLQDFIGVGMASLFHVNKLYGLLIGSVSLTGGHGTTSAWASTIESYGATNGGIIGYAAATYGLIVGGLIGGPLAKFILKHNKITTHKDNIIVKDETTEQKMDVKKTFNIIMILFICAGLAELINPYFLDLLHLINPNLSLPSYILSMIFATIFRNVYGAIVKQNNEKIPSYENDKIGDIALQLFLAIALTTLDLSTLVRLDSSIIFMFISTVLVQTIFILLFVYFVTFKVMKNRLVLNNPYDADVICAGHCGFGLGATPTAIANMDSFSKVNGFSVKAYLIVPIVGAMFIDFTNALFISLFLGFLV